MPSGLAEGTSEVTTADPLRGSGHHHEQPQVQARGLKPLRTARLADGGSPRKPVIFLR